MASSCRAEYVICWAVGLVILAGEYDSLDDLLLSRRVSQEYANRMGAKDLKRRNLPNCKIGEIVKVIANAFGLPPDRLTANSFKIGGASSEVEKALESAREQAQKAMHHRSIASSNHYIRYNSCGGIGSAAPWKPQGSTGIPTDSIRRSAAITQMVNSKETQRVRFEEEGKDQWQVPGPSSSGYSRGGGGPGHFLASTGWGRGTREGVRSWVTRRKSYP